MTYQRPSQPPSPRHQSPGSSGAMRDRPRPQTDLRSNREKTHHSETYRFQSNNFPSSPPPLPQPFLREVSNLPGLQEIEALRQVHALEHATVWLLSNHPEISTESTRYPQLQDDGRLSGLSTHYGFYLYGPATTARIKWAAATALDRLKAGDSHLAIHPRCGTNVAAQLLLTSGIAMGLSSLLPKRPLEQLAGLGLSAAAARLLAPDIGTWCQENLTTAIPHNLQLVQVTQTVDFWGRSAHFVRIHWVDSSK